MFWAIRRKKWRELMPSRSVHSGRSRPRPDDTLRKVIEQGSTQQAEFLACSKKTGSWLHLQTEMVPLLDANSQIESIVLLGRDVSENKKPCRKFPRPGLDPGHRSRNGRKAMARDFDQILTNVVGNLTIAKNLNGPHNAIAVRLNEIERSLQRARDLIEQMFSISSNSEQPRVRVRRRTHHREAITTVLRGTMIRAGICFSTQPSRT